MEDITYEKLVAWVKSGVAKKVPLDVLSFPMSLTTNEDVQKLVKGCIDPEYVLSKAATMKPPDIQSLISFSKMLDAGKATDIECPNQRRSYLMCVRVRDISANKLKIAHHIKLAIAVSMIAAFDAVGLDIRVIQQDKRHQYQTVSRQVMNENKGKRKLDCNYDDDDAKRSKEANDTNEKLCARMLELENIVYKLTEKMDQMNEMLKCCCAFTREEKASNLNSATNIIDDLDMDMFSTDLADEIAADLAREAAAIESF